ncbi:MAG: ArgE/DapE family deacylase [Candidatus Omnitrophota bacterium]
MVNKNRLVKLTQKLIKINSENPGIGEKQIASFVASFTRSLGLATKTYEFVKDRPNVLAILEGSSKNKKSILFSPHLDTVPAGSNWKADPFSGKIIKGFIFGRGATDCKGNLAVALEMLHSLVEDKIRLKNDIIFLATADEEKGSKFGLVPILEKNIVKADFAVILDSDDFGIVIAQKGLIHFKVKIFGKKAHGAYPNKDINAIELAAAIIQDFKKYKFKFKKHALLRSPTTNIGTIKGGDKVNIVSDWCEFEVDLRFLPGMNHKNILNIIKKIIKKHTNKFSLEINDIQKPYEIKKTHILAKNLLKNARLFKKHTGFCGSEGATVITFF